MLQRTKLGLLFVLGLLVLLTALPISAQETAAGLDVDVTEAGVSIYRVNTDGSRSLIIFVPAIPTETTAVEETISAQAADAISTGYLIVNVGALNVRSGPGAQYTVIATIAGGDELDVIGKNDGRENWWYVELANGQRGWINNIHVLVRGDLSGTPVVEHEGVLIQPTLYVGYPGNPIFPSLPHDGAPVCYLPGDSIFPIIGRSQLSSYYEIVATCQDGTPVTGWIEAQWGIVRNPAGLEFPVTDNN